jgi:hypothetical protein
MITIITIIIIIIIIIIISGCKRLAACLSK